MYSQFICFAAKKSSLVEVLDSGGEEQPVDNYHSIHNLTAYEFVQNDGMHLG